MRRLAGTCHSLCVHPVRLDDTRARLCYHHVTLRSTDVIYSSYSEPLSRYTPYLYTPYLPRTDIDGIYIDIFACRLGFALPLTSAYSMVALNGKLFARTPMPWQQCSRLLNRPTYKSDDMKDCGRNFFLFFF